MPNQLRRALSDSTYKHKESDGKSLTWSRCGCWCGSCTKNPGVSSQVVCSNLRQCLYFGGCGLVSCFQQLVRSVDIQRTLQPWCLVAHQVFATPISSQIDVKPWRILLDPMQVLPTDQSSMDKFDSSIPGVCCTTGELCCTTGDCCTTAGGLGMEGDLE